MKTIFTIALIISSVIIPPAAYSQRVPPNNVTIEGTETTIGGEAGGPSAATTTGNLKTTAFSRSGEVIPTPPGDNGPIPPGVITRSTTLPTATQGSPETVSGK